MRILYRGYQDTYINMIKQYNRVSENFSAEGVPREKWTTRNKI